MTGSQLVHHILAVCINERQELKKYPQDRVVVAKFGLEGDWHCREKIEIPGGLVGNFRQIYIASEQTLARAKRALGITLQPGDLGEHILVDGDDLSDIRPATSLTIGPIRLRVMWQNELSLDTKVYHRQLPQIVHNHRGIFCIVEAGAGHSIKPGDSLMLGISAPTSAAASTFR